MYKSIIDFDADGKAVVGTDWPVLAELYQNNCTMPHISRILYRLKDENTETPVLATVVFFNDGSKIVVKNSKHDAIHLEDKTLSNGTVIKIPTKQSLEVALMYALVKRMYTQFDEKGSATESCFGYFINHISKLSTIENVSEAEAKIAKANAKKAYEEAKKNAKPKKKRYSIHETLERVNMILDMYAKDKTDTEQK